MQGLERPAPAGPGDPGWRADGTINGAALAAVTQFILVRLEQVFWDCGRAVARDGLVTARPILNVLVGPTAGSLLKAVALSN